MTTVTLIINGYPYKAIQCTAYLAGDGETEADRRTMMLIDGLQYEDCEERNLTLIPEFYDDGDEIDEYNPYWSTDCDDLMTVMVDGEYYCPFGC